MPAAIEAETLVRRFGHRHAVDGVSFALRAGDCLALFGPNGAGKTTLLRMLAGVLRPTKGVVRIDGRVARDDAEARGTVGLISHHSMLYGPLTARENTEFAARLHGVRDAGLAATRALERMRVIGQSDVPVRSLSRGMQQRVSIARAIVHEPTVVLLDEPYTGLDAVGGAALTEILRLLRSHGATLVLVTHNVDEGLALATDAAVMLDGKFVRFERAQSIDAAQYVTDYRALLAGGLVPAGEPS
jgi:heme exporter protein A